MKGLFDDKRCKFKCGSIIVQTTKPFYEPGDTVDGKIYMEITKEMKMTPTTIILTNNHLGQSVLIF